MNKRIRRITKFAAAILIVQAAALLFLTPAGLDFIFPPVARVNAEKFSPDSNTYAVYYDIRAAVSTADLIVVGMDFGIAESYDLLGHFTRFVKQYNNLSAILLELTISQQNLAQNVLIQTEEAEFMKRMNILKDRTGMPADYCDYISELFIINRTMTPIRKMDILSYAVPSENEFALNAQELAAMSQAERVMDTYRSTERSALCIVNSGDLVSGSEFRSELDAFAAAEDLNVMYLQVQYAGNCVDGEGHPVYRFPDYNSDPTVFFVDNSKSAWFYRCYSTIAGLNRNAAAVADRLDTRYTDYYFVITHGTAAE